MICFGTCVGYPDKMRDLCIPGIEQSMGESYGAIPLPSNGESIFPVYRGG